MDERTAQKRVSRALEKLRRIFTKSGVTSTAAIIAGAISAHSVQAAPATLTKTISATALKGSAVAGSTLTLVKETLHVMNWMKTKTAAAIAVSALLAAGVAIASTHRNGSEAKQSQTQAHEAKLQAERAGDSANVASNPNAQKKLDEQKALAKRQR